MIERLPAPVASAAGRCAGILCEFIVAVHRGHWFGATALHSILGDVTRQLGVHLGEKRRVRKKGRDLNVRRSTP